MYAAKGSGALFVRRGVRLLAQSVGGHQERERRAGTEPVANIVAFGLAAELAKQEIFDRNEHTRGSVIDLKAAFPSASKTSSSTANANRACRTFQTFRFASSKARVC